MRQLHHVRKPYLLGCFILSPHLCQPYLVRQSHCFEQFHHMRQYHLLMIEPRLVRQPVCARQLHHVKKNYHLRLSHPAIPSLPALSYVLISYHLVLSLIHEATSLSEAAPSCGEPLFDEQPYFCGSLT